MTLNQKIKNTRNDISLQELLLFAKEYRIRLYKIRWILVIILFFGSMASAVLALLSKPTFTARSSFIFKEDGNAGLMAGLSGLGTLLGGGSSVISYSSLDRIVELSGSEYIVSRSLLDTSTINRKCDLLINHYIRIHNLRQKRFWRKDSLLVKANFNLATRIDSLNYSQRHTLKQIVKVIRGDKAQPDKALRVIFDKKSGLVNLIIDDTHDELALYLNQSIYKQLVEFYTQQATSTLNSRVRALQLKVDSIRYELSKTQSTSARINDQAQGLIRQSDKVGQKQFAVRENMLIMMYGEAVKNLEQLQFLLNSITPSFTLIDQPYLPIKPNFKKPWLFGIAGLAIGAVVMALGLAVYFVVYMTRPAPPSEYNQ